MNLGVLSVSVNPQHSPFKWRVRSEHTRELLVMSVKFKSPVLD